VRPSNSLRQRRAYVDDAQLTAPIHLVAERHRVGDDDLAQATLVENVDGVAAEYAVRDDGDNLAGAVILHRLGRLGQGSAGVRHVVDEDGDLVDDVAHEDHASDDVGTGALLVDQGEARVQAICNSSSSRNNVLAPATPSIILWVCLWTFAHRLAPPASGLTMTVSSVPRLSLIQRKTLGSAYRLSTGTLKKPWI